MPLKCCTHYVSKFGKPSSGHKTGKGQSSSQFPRRAALKNAQTTRQLPSPPMLVRLRSNPFKLGFSSEAFSVNWEHPDVQAGFRKIRGTRDHIANIHWMTEKAREFQKLTTLKLWTVWIITNCRKLFSSVAQWYPTLLWPLWTIAHQAPLSMGFSRQEYWSGLPFPPPRDLPRPGIKPVFPALAGVFFITVPPGEPKHFISSVKLKILIAIMEIVYWKGLKNYWTVQPKKR